MHDIEKYSNLHEVLPELLPVLKDSVQSDLLEIRKIDATSDKCHLVKEDFPVLENAVYVIYSKYIKKSEHPHETFIFLDEHGKSIAHISGRELALYGIIKPCEEFSVSDEYTYSDDK
ncbi:MAG: hypothetical protein V3S80_07600 [Sulfurimonadaceae bacterium]